MTKSSSPPGGTPSSTRFGDREVRLAQRCLGDALLDLGRLDLGGERLGPLEQRRAVLAPRRERRTCRASSARRAARRRARRRRGVPASAASSASTSVSSAPRSRCEARTRSGSSRTTFRSITALNPTDERPVGASFIRRSCRRTGVHFAALRVRGRGHLLPRPRRDHHGPGLRLHQRLPRHRQRDGHVHRHRRAAAQGRCADLRSPQHRRRVPVDRGRQDDLGRPRRRRQGHAGGHLRRADRRRPVESRDLAVRTALVVVARPVRRA